MNKLILAFLLGGCMQSHTPPTSFDASIPDVNHPEVIVEDAAIDVQVDAPPAHQNILLIGDSEVMYNHWYFKPMEKDNETVFFDSKPGTTIGWWNFHFKDEMAKYKNIDVVIVFLGTNNFNFTYLQEHQNIIDGIKSSNAKCIWVGPTNVRMKGWKNPHITGKLLKEAVAGTCTYFDTEAADIELADGIHPSRDGAINWLQKIWKVKDD